MAEVVPEPLPSTDDEVPAVPASASALIFDERGRLLILRPTYKSGWTIPGGVMENDGETPWQACRREVREECGLEVTSARLACVDFRRPGAGRAGGIRFLSPTRSCCCASRSGAGYGRLSGATAGRGAATPSTSRTAGPSAPSAPPRCTAPLGRHGPPAAHRGAAKCP